MPGSASWTEIQDTIEGEAEEMRAKAQVTICGINQETSTSPFAISEQKVTSALQIDAEYFDVEETNESEDEFEQSESESSTHKEWVEERSSESEEEDDMEKHDRLARKTKKEHVGGQSQMSYMRNRPKNLSQFEINVLSKLNSEAKTEPETTESQVDSKKREQTCHILSDRKALSSRFTKYSQATNSRQKDSRNLSSRVSRMSPQLTIGLRDNINGEKTRNRGDAPKSVDSPSVESNFNSKASVSEKLKQWKLQEKPHRFATGTKARSIMSNMDMGQRRRWKKVCHGRCV